MMPGRSLLAKVSGRSWAPVASTTRAPARARAARAVHRLLLGHQVVRAALDQRDIVVVVEAVGGGAAQHAHLGHGFQFFEGLRDPLGGRFAVDRGIAREQPAAQLGLLVAQDDRAPDSPAASAAAQAGDAAAHHQHVAMRVAFVVPGRIELGRRFAQAADGADALLEVMPGFCEAMKVL